MICQSKIRKLTDAEINMLFDLGKKHPKAKNICKAIIMRADEATIKEVMKWTGLSYDSVDRAIYYFKRSWKDFEEYLVKRERYLENQELRKSRAAVEPTPFGIKVAKTSRKARYYMHGERCLLIEYDTLSDIDEIIATKELLAYEKGVKAEDIWLLDN